MPPPPSPPPAPAAAEAMSDLLNDRVIRHPKSVLRLRIDELDALSDETVGTALAVCDVEATKPGASVEWTMARNTLMAVEARRWLKDLDRHTTASTSYLVGEGTSAFIPQAA